MNTILYNWWTFNSSTPFPADSITDAIIFNWYGLQNSNIKSSYKTDYNIAKIDLNNSMNPIVDWGIILNKKYSTNEIKIEWSVVADTAEELQVLMDNMKFKLSETEWFLDIKQADWTYRRTKATLISNDIFDKKHYNITHTKFKLNFISVEPFFYDRIAVANTLNNLASDVNIDIWYTGTATTSPQLYMIFNAAAWVSEITIISWDDTIEIAQAISVWDTLVIDCENKEVLYNGVEIDYTGTFLDITNWANIVEININGTFDYDFTYVYNKKRL